MSKKVVEKVECPDCHKMVSKRGLGGHVYNKHHHRVKDYNAQPAAGPADKAVGKVPPSPPAADNSTVSTSSLSDDLLKEAGMKVQVAPDGQTSLAPVVEPPSPYSVDAKTWGHILQFIGQQLDKLVDEVKKRKPMAIIQKVDLSESRANHVGQLMASQIGPIDPKTALLIEIAGLFLPTTIGLIAAIMPPVWLDKLTKGFNEMLKKVQFPPKEGVVDGQANPAQ